MPFIVSLPKLFLLYYLLDLLNESKNNCRAIVIYHKQKYSSQLSNHYKDKISTTGCTAIVPYKEADIITKISQDNNKVADVIEDSGIHSCRIG